MSREGEGQFDPTQEEGQENRKRLSEVKPEFRNITISGGHIDDLRAKLEVYRRRSNTADTIYKIKISEAFIDASLPDSSGVVDIGKLKEELTQEYNFFDNKAFEIGLGVVRATWSGNTQNLSGGSDAEGNPRDRLPEDTRPPAPKKRLSDEIID